MTIQPGIHNGIPADQYHDSQLTPQPALSAHYAHLLLTKSPRHAYTIHPQLGAQKLTDREERFDVGTAAHALLLEGRAITVEDYTWRVDDESIRQATIIRCNSKPFALITDAEDWRTKIAKDIRAEARAQGLVALLTVQWLQVQEMVASVRDQLGRLDVDPIPFTEGKPEQTLVWQEPNGVWCRGRADWLRDDHTAIDDLKTTKASANPHDWTRTTMWAIGADIQAAFYLRGLRALTGRTAEFRFVVAECQPPFALSVVSLAPDALALADEKIDKALRVWKECLDTDSWPAYTRQQVFAELPPWTSARWLEQQAAEEMEAEVAAA
jgi:hypothetical protein